MAPLNLINDNQYCQCLHLDGILYIILNCIKGTYLFFWIQNYVLKYLQYFLKYKCKYMLIFTIVFKIWFL